MLIAILIDFVSFIIGLVADILSAVSYLVPHQINDAFVKLFGYVNIGDGVFPFSQALLAILTVLSVWIFLYFVKVILFVFSLIPWIGKVVHLPSHSSSVTESEQYNARGALIGRNVSRRRWER